MVLIFFICISPASDGGDKQTNRKPNTKILFLKIFDNIKIPHFIRGVSSTTLNINYFNKWIFCGIYRTVSNNAHDPVFFNLKNKLTLVGRGKVWKRAVKDLKIENITSTVKHGGGKCALYNVLKILDNPPQLPSGYN